MTKLPKDIGASVRARLLRLAHERGADFQLVLTRYARQIGIDYATSEFVAFPEHLPGRFHGYVVPWEQLTQRMQSALRKAGMVDKKGRILTD